MKKQNISKRKRVRRMNKEEIIKSKMQTIAKKIKEELPEGFGFILMAFEFDKKGKMIYVSNSCRDDVVKAMQEFIEVTKDNYGNDTGKY